MDIVAIVVTAVLGIVVGYRLGQRDARRQGVVVLFHALEEPEDWPPRTYVDRAQPRGQA